MILLPLALTGCFGLSGVEEASLALKKWQHKPISDFFFKYGKGEFQAKNSQGIKAYFWQSPIRNVQTDGETITVKVPHEYKPDAWVEKTITQPGTTYRYQCKLRIETNISGSISSIVNMDQSSECARYFSLPDSEIKAILEARKNS